MKFIDQVRITVQAGKGGSGAIGWRREKYLPRGGPNGGNGGPGGAVIFQSDPGRNTLIEISFNPLVRAGNGGNGEGALKDGAQGSDVYVKLPVGTQVFYKDKLVADLAIPHCQWVAARGGRGGKGNNFFKSSTRRAPDYAQPGEPGEEFTFELVLKSVADIGLVGLPNVGKSTLVKSITRAAPKIADYPFTTLTPQLGVVLSEVTHPFVIADIPGLVPGAHKGKGLGIQFLKHIERTKILLHVVDLSQDKKYMEGISEEDLPSDNKLYETALEQYRLLEKELASFSDDLLAKPRALVFSKLDLPINAKVYKTSQKISNKLGIPVWGISSATKNGLDNLCLELSKMVQEYHHLPNNVIA